METILVLPRESLICSICDDLLEKPYECNSCNNLFCEECIKSYLDTKDKYRRLYFCPLCRNKKNNFCENSKINDLIEDFKKSGKKICKKCKSILNQENFRNHINKCWYKCSVCHLLFSNETNFLEHFLEKNELIKVIDKFNRKTNSKINNNDNKSNNNNSDNEKKYGKIKREKFENNLVKKENEKEENNFVIIDKTGYNIEYDLYFCGKNNGINCKCCESKICSPEGEICPHCMRNNLKFHNLKGYYLINKKGKACRYSHGNYHCYTKFDEIKQDKGGNYKKKKKICSDKYTCQACKDITELMNYYLSTNTIKKLIERDAQNRKKIKNSYNFL